VEWVFVVTMPSMDVDGSEFGPIRALNGKRRLTL
jgi:hypothetical protein